MSSSSSSEISLFEPVSALGNYDLPTTAAKLITKTFLCLSHLQVSCCFSAAADVDDDDFAFVQFGCYRQRHNKEATAKMSKKCDELTSRQATIHQRVISSRRCMK